MLIAIRTALATELAARPTGECVLIIGALSDTLPTVELAAHFGVYPVPVPIRAPAGYPDTTTTVLNVRTTANGALIGQYKASAQVSVMPDTAVVTGGYTWRKTTGTAINGQSITGWCADAYLTKTVPVIPEPAPIPPSPAPKPTTKHLAGLHVLVDGVPAAERFMSVVKVPSVTGVNVSDFLNWAVDQGVQYVIGRVDTGSGDTPPIPSDAPAEADAFGTAWIAQQWPAIASWREAIYFQPFNELAWGPGHNALWLAVMKALEAHGRKAAIMGYSVGTPEPAQWVQMTEALTYAKAHGHIGVLHAYGKPGDPAGTLTPPAENQYYELRAIKELYPAVPDTARPPLVLGEFAGEFTAKFDGPAALIAVNNMFESEIAGVDYLKGYNMWSFGGNGGWSSTDIESAVPQLVQWEGS